MIIAHHSGHSRQGEGAVVASRDKHNKVDELLADVIDLKRKLHSITYKSRDKSIEGDLEYLYPKMLFFYETNHQTTGHFHTNLITEKLLHDLKTQCKIEALLLI